ncbi:MAG: NADH-quinone oxidoreductase subunit L, partial [Bacteroidota bacterium]
MNAYQSLLQSYDFQPIQWLILGIVCLPFIGFLLVRIWGNKLPQGGQWIAFGCMLGSFLVSLGLAIFTWNVEGDWSDLGLHMRGQWFQISGPDHPIHFTIGLRADKLAILMSCLVSGISSMVLLFSQAYMKKETHLDRYWAYVCLFVVAMQGIVLADSLILIFVGWELVGLASYFLIGFFFDKDKPARAAQKAFLVNRIGDTFFLMGMAILFSFTQTLDLDALWTLLSQGQVLDGSFVLDYSYLPEGLGDGSLFQRSIPLIWLQLAGLFIIGGALGKSAQFPLQTWLPDAMEGPTPVSSLIHAATMVAAGVYLVARIYFLLFDWVQICLAIIGGITMFMAAIAALTQWDIKRILAYSTISQLGYMMMGMGVGAYDDSLFHLFTHAFFKCGLFLVAAVIIDQFHQISIEKRDDIPSYNDIRNMGGLRKEMPVVFRMFMFMMLALVGIPFTSGFLSKEGIIMGVLDWANGLGGWAWILAVLALLGVFLTAFYMGRMTMWVFLGEKRNEVKIGKVSWKMWFPLLIMAIGSFWFPISWNPFESSGWLFASLDTPPQIFQEVSWDMHESN